MNPGHGKYFLFTIFTVLTRNIEKLFVCLFLLLITYENSLDQDQHQPNVGPDLFPNCMELIGCLEVLFKNVFYVKNHEKLPSMQKSSQGLHRLEKYLNL